MAEAIVILGMFFILLHIALYVVCLIFPKKALWLSHLALEVISCIGVFLVLFSLNQLSDAGLITSGDTLGLALLSVMGLCMYAGFFVFSSLTGLIVWFVKRKKNK